LPMNASGGKHSMEQKHGTDVGFQSNRSLEEP